MDGRWREGREEGGGGDEGGGVGVRVGKDTK